MSKKRARHGLTRLSVNSPMVCQGKCRCWPAGLGEPRKQDLARALRLLDNRRLVIHCRDILAFKMMVSRAFAKTGLYTGMKAAHLPPIPRGYSHRQQTSLYRTRRQVVQHRMVRFRQQRIIVSGPFRHQDGLVQYALF